MKIDLQLWYINRSVTRGTPTPWRFSHNSGMIEGLFDLNDRFSEMDIAEEIMMGVMLEWCNEQRWNEFISCEKKTEVFFKQATF